MGRDRFITWVISLLFAVLWATPLGAAPANPSQVVTAFHESLLGVMKSRDHKKHYW